MHSVLALYDGDALTLDGKAEGVVARAKLCKIHFNINSTLGLPYACAANHAQSLGFKFGSKIKRQLSGGGGGSNNPATNGTVSA